MVHVRAHERFSLNCFVLSWTRVRQNLVTVLPHVQRKSGEKKIFQRKTFMQTSGSWGIFISPDNQHYLRKDAEVVNY